MKSLHVNIFRNNKNFYHLTKDEVISSINEYIKTEPLRNF